MVLVINPWAGWGADSSGSSPGVHLSTRWSKALPPLNLQSSSAKVLHRAQKLGQSSALYTCWPSMRCPLKGSLNWAESMETSSALRSDPLRALWSTASRSSRRCSSPKDPTLEGAPTLSATTSSSVVIETIVSHFYLYIYRYLANVDVIILTWEHVLLVTYISRLIKDLL